MSKPFQFKQFALTQNESAQKMSTDSMLLGALAELEGAMNILDIGTGTGVLALMMAQKHPEALVDAVEKDEASAKEAEANFEASPWAYRLTSYAQDFEKFIADETLHYDLIVSNPPYFEKIETEKSRHSDWPDSRRQDARTSTGLSFESLIDGVQRVLVNYGKFYVVLPIEQADKFIQMSEAAGLYLSYRMDVRHHPESPVHRVILAFAKEEVKCEGDEMYLREADGSRSLRYTEITSEFHLD